MDYVNRRRGVPYVMLSRSVDGVDADTCVADNVARAAAVLSSFSTCGHTRIGAVFGPRTTSTGRERAAGFRRGLAERGAPLAARYEELGPSHQDTGRAALEQLMAERPAPTGLFWGIDVVARGVCNCARAAGVDIPGELTVVGFDDIPMASWEVLALTTIRVDLSVMSQRAASLPVERIKTPDLATRRVVLTPELVARGTHARLAERAPLA